MGKPINSHYPKGWNLKKALRRLEQVCKIVIDIMPIGIQCPACDRPGAFKTTYTLDNDDTFVLFYICPNCGTISILEIEKENSTITTSVPTRNQLEITIETYSGLRDCGTWVNALKEQLLETPPDDMVDTANLN